MSNIKLYNIRFAVLEQGKVGVAQVTAENAKKAQEVLQGQGKYNGYKYAMEYPELVHTTDTFTAEAVVSELDNPMGEKGEKGDPGNFTTDDFKTFGGQPILGSGDLLHPMPNEIWYYTTNNKLLTPYDVGVDIFGANIVSNTYEDGQGVLTFDDTVTSIGNGAFISCSRLKTITLGEGVETIGKNAFSSCTSLKNITIPDSVTSIGERAFSNCISLASITIPDSVTSIENYAFRNCTSLTSVTIGNGVTSIGNGAFFMCKGELTIGSSIMHRNHSNGDDAPASTWLSGSGFSKIIINAGYGIGTRAFINYSPLQELIMWRGISTIGSAAFQNCDNLRSITISDRVTNIGRYAFRNCDNLATIIMSSSEPPTISTDVFNASSTKIIVDKEVLTKYKSATNWSEYASKIVGTEYMQFCDNPIFPVTALLESRIQKLE